MNELEKQVKDIIIDKYGSLKRFCEEVDMPWSTLDSILKRGFANSNIGNVLKVARELDIEAEPLAFGVLQKRLSTPADPPQLTEQQEEFIKLSNNLSEEQVARILAYAQAIYDLQSGNHHPAVSIPKIGEKNAAEEAEHEVDRIVAQELAAAKKSKVSIK